MRFLRVVEVFQPLFRLEGGGRIDLRGGLEELAFEVRGIRDLCDVVLVGDHKDPSLLKVSAVETAALLEREAGVQAAPVIVARDSNRSQTLSAIVTAYGLGLQNIMIAWGDRYSPPCPKNVYDFPNLSTLISEARRIADRARVRVRIFAPVDLRMLESRRGVRVARSRLHAGADLLLAQPPTTDPCDALEAHDLLLSASGMRESILLGVFPFRSAGDVARCETFFGWNLPSSIHRLARSGSEALTAEASRVVKELKARGHPGVYVSTRGTPRTAKELMG